MADEFLDEVTLRWEAEGLFARDINGQLIRLTKTTAEDYEKQITLTIDGREVTIEKAVQTADSQGNILNDADGKSIPRRTTIYDAAQRLFVQELGSENPIPTICHREHMRPVGVCRVCCVEVCRENRDGKVVPGQKLVPACHHPVEPGMIVHTINSPDEAASRRLRNAVLVLTELLAADHLLDDTARTSGAAAQTNELAVLAERMHADRSRFAGPPRTNTRKPDNSSPLIAVNHDACILCERCKRACDEIKENHVIGRTGKGYTAGIAFDLDYPMEESTCVSCGECMVSCPTDALTFRKPIESDWHKQMVARANCFPISAEELQVHPLFRAIPLKWLQWNEDTVVRRVLEPGEPLCWLGDYGSTAFILFQCKFGLWFNEPSPNTTPDVRGEKLGWLNSWFRRTRGRSRTQPDLTPPQRSVPAGVPDATRTAKDLILGEMTCLNDYPRSATIVALEQSEVWEIRRNVLYMLERDAAAREELEKVYRERALQTHLESVSLFKNLEGNERKECIEFLRDKVKLMHIDPGQIIFRQGQPADDFYMVRLGYVKVSQRYLGQDRVLDYLGPNTYFGEIGLLSGSEELVKLEVPEGLAGKRTATCSALDDVELVRISGKDFRELLSRHKSLRDRFREIAPRLLKKDEETRKQLEGKLVPFLEQGLYNAQKLLVLDLESCTRCDECVRACADTHGGVTRLVREGLRFDKYLVASACRSCEDPYCLVGCPVDSIHRLSSLEIVIEDHCIGCGQCATNCPYGNINMVGFNETRDDPRNPGRTMAVVQQRATTCDLCQSVGVDASHADDEVSCVYACPHNAAFRMSGQELLARLDGTPRS